MKHRLESYEQALNRLTRPTARSEMRANAAFGNTNLIDQKHFHTPRDSKLPWHYFDPDPNRMWWTLTGFLAVVLMLGILAAYLGVI